MSCCSVGLLLMTSVGTLATVCYVVAQQPEPKQASLPDGLRHVPADALGFLHVRAADFLKSELGSQLLKEVQQDSEAKKGLANIEREIELHLGMKLADLDTVTFLVLGPPTLSQLQGIEMRMMQMQRQRPGYDRPPVFDKGMPFKDAMPKDFFEKKVERFEGKIKADDKQLEVMLRDPLAAQVSYQPLPGEFAHATGRYLAMSGPLVIVTSTKTLDRKKILRSNVIRGNADGGRGGFFSDVPFEKSVLFLSDRTIMVGAAWEVERYSEQMARNPGPQAKPMQAALALGAKSHIVIAGGHVPADLRRSQFFPSAEILRALAPLSPLLQAEAGVALDLGKNLNLTLAFKGTTAENAEQTLQAAKNLRVLAELAMEKNAEDAGESGGWKLVLEKRMKQALADAVIEQVGLNVRAQFTMELDPVLVKRYTKELVANVRTKANSTQSINNLKNIALAMHGYHDSNKALPPAGISNLRAGDGKPLLSWRVAILPYIEQGPLYQQFDLTQPWDHPTNKRLIARMPQTYVVPGTENKEGYTHYRVLVGPGTMFEALPGNGGIRFSGITDGTSNTLMVVEAADPTIWTRPDDLPYNPNAPLPKLGTTPDGFNAAMGDGTARFFRSATPEATLRALITRNGGEPVTVPD